MAHTKEAMSQGLCPECEIGPFTRNNYFTGKLLVEADFTDEQRYHREKLRHHNQRLHGWGVVCGLKVKQHENSACRGRFICIEPGTAIDCCGHEIVVREQEYFDFTRVDKVKELYKKKDTASPTLQVCISYKECPTEEIPVLYDECGCDDTRCAPNRILESYEFDVKVVDQQPDTEELHMPRLQWDNTVTLAHASRVALHDATHNLYVMVAKEIIKVSTENNAIELPSQSLPANGVELAISNNGTRLYVVTQPSDSSTTTLQLFIYDATNLGNPPINKEPINLEGSEKSGEVYLAVAPTPDNRLFALVPQTGKILVWATDIDTSPNPAAQIQFDFQGTNLAGLAISSNGQYAYTTDAANHTIHILDVARMKATPSPITVSPAASPSTLAIVSSTGSDLLAVADQNNKQLYLVDPNLTSPASFGPVPLPYNPLDLVASPAGHRVYVLEQDGTNETSYVQAVNVAKMQQQGSTVQPSAAVKVGDNSQQLILSKSGRRIYIPYGGDPEKKSDGGVAVLNVTEQACEDLLWRQLDECPHCDVANCVVLATIENYKINNKIEDQTDPPAMLEENVSRIDNHKGRRLLPSIQTLTEVLKCVMENGVGGVGVQGPKGDPGLPGKQGDPGPGLEKDLVGISALSWQHASKNEIFGNTFLGIGGEDHLGLVIGFTKPVKVDIPEEDAHHVFEVQVDRAEVVNKKQGTSCLCSMRGRIVPVKYELHEGNPHRIKRAWKVTAPALGIAFIPEPLEQKYTEFKVRLRGDFVLEANPGITDIPHIHIPRAIDAEFVRHELPTGHRVLGSDGSWLGLQGGLFESWFTLGGHEQLHLVNVNLNTGETLLKNLQEIGGIKPDIIDKIVKAREQGRFTNTKDFLNRVGITPGTWTHNLSKKITLEE